MAKELVMPKMGMSMEEGTVVLWHKQEGEPVKKGEPVAAISSEKIENEVEAPEDGVLLKIRVQADETAKVGDVIGVVGAEGEIPPEAGQASGTETAKETEPAAVPSAPQAAPAATSSPEPSMERRIRVSPAAKKLAKEKGVDIAHVTGSGPKGRITREDILNAAKEPTPAPLQPESAASEEMPHAARPDTKDYKGIRKVIGERMHESLTGTAQLTIMRYADVTGLMMFRQDTNRALESVSAGKKFTITDLIAKAVVLALKKHPFMNSALHDDVIYEYRHIHLGIAASMERGLVVPVVRDADRLSLPALSDRIRTLGQKAKEQTLTTDEMKGSTFTISNLGASGVGFFTPILNPPETGILGVGAGEAFVSVSEGAITEGTRIPLSLTFDHRIIDGEPASRFLVTVTELLEQPHALFSLEDWT